MIQYCGILEKQVMKHVLGWGLMGWLLVGSVVSADEAAHPHGPAVAGHEKTASVTSASSEVAGIHIEHIRVSAQGRMIDLRYRVTDAKKSAFMGEKEFKPYLIDQATGLKLVVPNSPKVGPLRQLSKDPDKGKIYFSMFSNPGMVVKSGSKVALVLGEYKIENLVVE